jgi:DNA-binding LacI/PurR family transcriptional regulator
LSTRYARLGKATQQWYDIGREIAIELFSCEKRPTALLTPGITFASGAWQGLNELGLKIPEDVSFVATNPIRAINPYMSGLCVPIRKLAEKAVSLVLDQFTPGKHLKQKIYEFPVEFVEAGSCRILPRK